MAGSIKIDDGSGNYTILTNAGSLGSDKTITVPNTTGTMALNSNALMRQVVQATYSTATEVASTSYADSGLSASITPSSASNKVLIIVSQNIQPSITDNGIKGYMKLLRDSTDIITENLFEIITGNANSNLIQANFPIVYLDSPSSASSITYKTQMRVNSTSASGKITAQNESSSSSITLIEVGA